MKHIKPFPLKAGMQIGIVAPASPVATMAVIRQNADRLEALGFRTKCGENVQPGNGDLAGSDWERLSDWERMWTDTEVAGLWALRGGWGSLRLLPFLNYRNYAMQPKVVVGFSDITALELAIWNFSGLVTFHGPVLTTLESDFTIAQALRMLNGSATGTELIWPDPANRDGFMPIRPGRARGILLGGNLTTLLSLLGTPYLPNFEKKILFLEETQEATYRIDRMLTQLSISGILDTVAAVVVGRCVPAAGQTEENLKMVFRERLERLTCPTAYGFPIGHHRDQWTIPQGIEAEIDTWCGNLTVVENPVFG